MLKKREVRTYKVELICDECGAPMEFTGMVLTSCPAQFPHKCPKCGNRKTVFECYPKIEYEYVDEEKYD